MKKVLLFPGAFNPPHNGHVEIVKLALQEREFDELWIMPSGKRRDKNIDISYDHRINLGEMFISYLKTQVELLVVLLDDELKDSNGRYTEEIMDEIKSRDDISITQLIGSDGIVSLYNEDRSILTKEVFIVVQREGNVLPNDFPRDNIDVIDGATLEISSTEIREMIKNNNQEYNKFVSENIAEYIRDHNLYKS